MLRVSGKKPSNENHHTSIQKHGSKIEKSDIGIKMKVDGGGHDEDKLCGEGGQETKWTLYDVCTQFCDLLLR